MKNIERISVWDIDGVLVDSSHRYQTIDTPNGKKIDLEHWRNNEHLCFHDSLLPHAETYKQHLQDATCFVIIATAREMKKPDFDFIEQKLGNPDAFVYRAIGDSTSGSVLKATGIHKTLIEIGLSITGVNLKVYEDNVDYLKYICDYFRCTGIYIPSKQGY